MVLVLGASNRNTVSIKSRSSTGKSVPLNTGGQKPPAKAPVNWLAHVAHRQLFNTNHPHLMNIGNPLQHFLDTVLLQRSHTVV